MTHERAHVVIPTEILTEIDQLVGARKRSQFLVAAAERELVRLKQLKAIRSAVGAWAKEDHPELESGSSTAYVQKIRRESDRRLKS